MLFERELGRIVILNLFDSMRQFSPSLLDRGIGTKLDTVSSSLRISTEKRDGVPSLVVSVTDGQ